MTMRQLFIFTVKTFCDKREIEKYHVVLITTESVNEWMIKEEEERKNITSGSL